MPGRKSRYAPFLATSAPPSPPESPGLQLPSSPHPNHHHHRHSQQCQAVLPSRAPITDRGPGSRPPPQARQTLRSTLRLLRGPALVCPSKPTYRLFPTLVPGTREQARCYSLGVFLVTSCCSAAVAVLALPSYLTGKVVGRRCAQVSAQVQRHPARTHAGGISERT